MDGVIKKLIDDCGWKNQFKGLMDKYDQNLSEEEKPKALKIIEEEQDGMEEIK